ncbi:NnrS family protein [Photobacterium damselae subsp. damselae]|uniref:NnrS family protein n=2 Tax=Photobacterium damselae TaxID=38293 RepID=A0AAD3WUH1_PHODD|nr:NnrS family protein [Photobacterium damselae subsp. damselae]
MQILDNEKEQKIIPIFRLAFRPFFLSAALFSAVAMVVWAMFWSGSSHVTGLMYGQPIWWHAHEMMIGFTGAIIIGFLLTAVQTWTGVPGIRSTKLAIVFTLWLIARIGLLFGQPSYIWMFIDLSWIPLAAYFLLKPILLRRQWNNLFFAPLLLLLTALNVQLHLIAMGLVENSLRQTSFVALVVIAIIVLVVGGRVIPFFTWRGTQTEQITRVKWIEYAALIPVWLLLIATFLPLPSNYNWIVANLLMVTAVTNMIRFVRWRTLSTLKVPLLWCLHLAYLCMILGLFAIGLSMVSHVVSYSIALHLMTVGGIGGMILSMMARVSLGHTGRSLQVGCWVQIAFVCLLLSTLVRSVLIWVYPSLTINGYVFSAILWAIAFSIFTIVYYPILTKPRVDGRPG